MKDTGRDLLRKHMVKPGYRVRLQRLKTAAKCGCETKQAGLAALGGECERLARLQQVLYAQGKHAVLVVLQAMDTAGKDGTIRHVLGPLNPQGVSVTSFKKPTPAEAGHDYLWRIHQAVPARGMIGVFNRSHYEDVLVARVHRFAPKTVIERRYREINAFERYLADNGVTIVKLFLHISKREQKERLQARLRDPRKHWKFDVHDLTERKLWDDYMRAYELAMSRCSTPWAPWYVIPADRKWARNLLVARILRLTLEGLRLRFPKPAADLDGVVIPD